MKQQIQFKVTIAPNDDIGDGGPINRKEIINQLVKEFRACVESSIPNGYGVVTFGPMVLNLEKGNAATKSEDVE